MNIQKTLASLMLLTTIVVSANAQTSRQQTASQQATAALDTIIKATPVPADSFSHAAGIMLSSSLQTYAVQRMNVDPAYMNEFINGLRALPDEAYAKKMMAYAAGLTIGVQNQKEIIPDLNRTATGKADSNYVVAPIFIDALVQGIKQQDATVNGQAQAVVERQVAYQSQVYQYANTQFLIENGRNKDVVTLPSGLQYRIIEKGQGAVATDTSTVEVNYEGKLIDGTVFDSSYQRGQSAEFKPTQVIKGWTEALTMMPEGSTWELFIPYNLAYGEQGNRSIPGYSTLIFKVQVIKVKP
ncbi:MAG: FKBP-type peptidyl-prolyl cis-trans isomerase [Bacteroidaceae bacterium]|nr:FKBP-type peptidyl-prolyl cis-trans isomerase [Bacteroidaceae bacterium]